jgi:hypothetical protein
LNSGPGAWYHPAGGGEQAAATCAASGSAGSIDCAYVLVSTPGATTVTATFSGTTGGATVYVEEVSYINGPIQAELPIASYQAPGGTILPGSPLWIGGANDIIFQAIQPNQPISAIGGGFTLSGNIAYLENTTTGTAPTWTESSSGAAAAIVGIAFQEYQPVSGGLDPQWIVFDRANSKAADTNCFTVANMSTSSAGLNLEAQLQSATCNSVDEATQDYSYTSGEIAMRSFNFLYGTIEFSGKFGGGTGTGSWPSVWMLDASCQPSDPTGTDDNCNSQEIDMAEVYGTFTNVNQQIHVDNQTYDNGCTATTTDVSENYHVYDLVWSAGSLVWMIDGVTTCTVTESYVPSGPMYVKIGGFMGGATGGTINNSTLPWNTNIQYLEVTQGSTVVFSDTFNGSASITNVSPGSGPVSTTVTITGTNFGATQGTSTVTFNGTAGTPTSWSATSVVVPVPSGAATGNVVVTVGGAASNGVSFSVTSSPAISLTLSDGVKISV